MAQTPGYIKVDYGAATGIQTIVEVDPTHDVTAIVKAGAGDDVSLEIMLTTDPVKNGIRVLEVGTISSTISKTTQGPIAGIGITIVTNVSNDIQLEIGTSYRGG